jgi:hypothetical protein
MSNTYEIVRPTEARIKLTLELTLEQAQLLQHLTGMEASTITRNHFDSDLFEVFDVVDDALVELDELPSDIELVFNDNETFHFIRRNA